MEFLELEFEFEVFPTKINIYETYNPGCTSKISGLNAKGEWITFWEGPPEVGLPAKSRIFSPTLKNCDFKTKNIRLDMNCMKTVSYYELDAILLLGRVPPKEFSKQSGLNFCDNNRTITLSNGPVTTHVTVINEFGKQYCSFKLGYFTNKMMIGAIETTQYDPKKTLKEIGYCYNSSNGCLEKGDSTEKYGVPYRFGDEIGLLFDADAKSLEFFVNGQSQGVAFENLTFPLYAAVTLFDVHDSISYDPLRSQPTFETMKFVASYQVVMDSYNFKSGNLKNTQYYGTYILGEGSYFWNVKIEKCQNPSSIFIGVIAPKVRDSSKALTMQAMDLKENDVVSVSVNFTKKQLEFLVNGNLIELKYPIEGKLVPFISLMEEATEVFVDLNAVNPLALVFYCDNKITLPEGVELTNKNLTARKVNKLKGPVSVFGNKIYDKGRHYFSVTIDEDEGSNNDMMVGIADPNFQKNNQFLSHGPSGWAYYGWGNSYHNSKASTYGPRFRKGDKIGCAFDLDKFTVEFFKNDVYLGVAFTK
jgi:hypothetical protein